MKVVIDANVWISAAIQKGPSYVIVDRWLAGAEIEVVICPELLYEISEVLTSRERLRKWISHERAATFIEMIGTMVDLVPDSPVEDVGIRDIEDAYLVSCPWHGCTTATSSSPATRISWSGSVRNRHASLQLRS